jgi:hypothetical protein
MNAGLAACLAPEWPLDPHAKDQDARQIAILADFLNLTELAISRDCFTNERREDPSPGLAED